MNNLSKIIIITFIIILCNKNGFTQKKYDTKINQTLITATLSGSKVCDPRLTGASNVIIKYKIIDPVIKPSGYDPRVEVVILDSLKNQVACLQVKSLTRTPNNIEQSVTWDGKWGIKTNGSNTDKKGEFVDPKKYSVYLFVYTKSTDLTPSVEKAYNLFVVRLGITEIDFINSTDSDVFPMKFHKKISVLDNDDYLIPEGKEWLLDNLDRIEPTCKEDVSYPDDRFYNYPVAYKKNSKCKIKATMGINSQKCIIPAGTPSIQLSTGMNTKKVYNGVITGGNYEFESESVVNANISSTTYPIVFTFCYNDTDDFDKDKILWESLGTQNTSHVIYTVHKTPLTAVSYIELLEWSTRIISGNTINKDIDIINLCYGKFNNAMKNGNVLKYGVRAWGTEDVLDNNGGMCGGLQDTFADLVGTQGIKVERIGYYIQINSRTTSTLDSSPSLDDKITPNVGVGIMKSNFINVGNNGINESTCHDDDTFLIPKGKGLPNRTSIKPGSKDPRARLVISDIDTIGTDDTFTTLDTGEKVLLSGINGINDVHGKDETFDDVGLDGLADKDEPGYNVVTNPDPNKDNWNVTTNPTGTEKNYIYDYIDDTHHEPFTDINGNGTLDMDNIEIPFGAGHSKYDPRLSISYPPVCIAPTKSPAWHSIVITSAGLNLGTPLPNSFRINDYKDVDKNYPLFVDPNDVIERKNQNRWEFYGPYDGHALIFYQDTSSTTNDIWMYDPTFLGGPWKNLFINSYTKKPMMPDLIMNGNDNVAFFLDYYINSVPYHLGTVKCKDTAGNLKIGIYSVKTSLIPIEEIIHVWKSK